MYFYLILTNDFMSIFLFFFPSFFSPIGFILSRTRFLKSVLLNRRVHPFGTHIKPFGASYGYGPKILIISPSLNTVVTSLVGVDNDVEDGVTGVVVVDDVAVCRGVGRGVLGVFSDTLGELMFSIAAMDPGNEVAPSTSL